VPKWGSRATMEKVTAACYHGPKQPCTLMWG
jgi:hypothetical protein